MSGEQDQKGQPGENNSVPMDLLKALFVASFTRDGVVQEFRKGDSGKPKISRLEFLTEKQKAELKKASLKKKEHIPTQLERAVDSFINHVVDLSLDKSQYVVTAETHIRGLESASRAPQHTEADRLIFLWAAAHLKRLALVDVNAILPDASTSLPDARTSLEGQPLTCYTLAAQLVQKEQYNFLISHEMLAPEPKEKSSKRRRRHRSKGGKASVELNKSAEDVRAAVDTELKIVEDAVLDRMITNEVKKHTAREIMAKYRRQLYSLVVLLLTAGVVGLVFGLMQIPGAMHTLRAAFSFLGPVGATLTPPGVILVGLLALTVLIFLIALAVNSFRGSRNGYEPVRGPEEGVEEVAENDIGLPEGWRYVDDPEGGYYWNDELQDSQWERPAYVEPVGSVVSSPVTAATLVGVGAGVGGSGVGAGGASFASPIHHVGGAEQPEPASAGPAAVPQVPEPGHHA